MCHPPATCHATPDWAPLRALLIGFPTRPDTWRRDALPAQHAVLKFVTHILETTQLPVCIVTPPGLPPKSDALLSRFRRHPRVTLHPLPMDDCWLRDTGPIFTTTPTLTATCFAFNAWGAHNGGCYRDFGNDRRLGPRLARLFSIPAIRVDAVLEGGSVSSDGDGTILTTEECLLNPNRNPHLRKRDIERLLARFLRAGKVLWLPYGAAFDGDTDGHVDNIAVFARPGHVVLAVGGCPEQAARSAAAERVLSAESDARGRPFVVHTLSTPVLRRTSEEATGVQAVPGVVPRTVSRICASYVNFVLCGDCVFVPRFGVPEDRQAETVLSDVFPDRRVVMVDAREFVLAGGGLHCLTLGIPR